MVPRNLIIFLVLLWTMHHNRTERIIKTKYRETKVVNYRQDNDDPNTLLNCTFLDCDEYGFISKPVARPEYGMIYQDKGMLLQNLHRRYLYILIKLPHLSDLEQQIPDFPNCDNYGYLTASNPDPMLDDTPTNDNELHQVICNTFKIDSFQEMDTIVKL